MKHELNIGIVEDELLIAAKIKMILTEIGYAVCKPVSSYEDAMNMIKTEKPDLILLDINLGKEKDGIHIAQAINDQFSLPFIFLTANSDMATIERAKKVRPLAYLVKPFTKDELFTSIEIAVNNFNTARQATPKKTETDEKNDYIFVRDNHRFIKIRFNGILYIESRENYVVINTVDQKQLTLRSTFNEFLSQLPSEKFFRTHRGFAVQTDLIENVGHSEVTVAGKSIPLSNAHRDDLFSHLGIKQ